MLSTLKVLYTVSSDVLDCIFFLIIVECVPNESARRFYLIHKAVVNARKMP